MAIMMSVLDDMEYGVSQAGAPNNPRKTRKRVVAYCYLYLHSITTKEKEQRGMQFRWNWSGGNFPLSTLTKVKTLMSSVIEITGVHIQNICTHVKNTFDIKKSFVFFVPRKKNLSCKEIHNEQSFCIPFRPKWLDKLGDV
ncbi:unnamed protein product [Orchesella dallaii]|uniref:Uncharacterized protein n=1 Tax=Orchesella dallaii TaxID=48710 RepID=A0ABP1QJV4_9HEXA